MARKKNIQTDISAPIAYKQTKEDVERQRKYEAEDAMRTLTRAEEIRNNRDLMGRVKKIAEEQVRAAKKFCK